MTTSHACHMKRRDGVMIIHIVWFDTKWTTMISAKSYLLTQSRLRHEENRKSKAKAAAIGTAREKIVKNRKSPFWSLLFEERECFTSILFFYWKPCNKILFKFYIYSSSLSHALKKRIDIYHLGLGRMRSWFHPPWEYWGEQPDWNSKVSVYNW